MEQTANCDLHFSAMIFTQSLPMADLVHENYLLLPVINRFGISLGFGSKTVDEVCTANGINTAFFLEMINAYHNKDFFPEVNLQAFSLSLIVDYLKKTHGYFAQIKIPQIGDAINTLLDTACADNKDKILLVKALFDEYRTELLIHTGQEDREIYPYTLRVELEYQSEIPDAAFIESIRANSIRNYAEHHSNIDEKLLDIKNIIIKYLPPLTNSNLQNTILFDLFNLERELGAHTMLEEKVLVPKVLRMENELLEHSPRRD